MPAQTVANPAPAAEPAAPAAIPGPSMGGPAGIPASAPPSSTAIPFRFDAKRWSQADRIVAIATLVLFISLFLPWFSYRFAGILGGATYSWNGLVHGYLYISLILCLGIMAYLVALAGFERLPFKMPIGHEAAILGATVVNLLLVVIAFFDKPYGFGVGWSFGAFLSLIAAIVAAAPLGLPVIQAARKPKS